MEQNARGGAKLPVKPKIKRSAPEFLNLDGAEREVCAHWTSPVMGSLVRLAMAAVAMASLTTASNPVREPSKRYNLRLLGFVQPILDQGRTRNRGDRTSG
jgi:hypothetical protein